MTTGAFKSFVHDHRFHEQDGVTLMKDELRFAAPFGVLGFVVEKLALGHHLTRFLRERNQFVKHVAESQMWRQYLSKAESL
jgi:ligand-binding SRPBCC domain-containing protein